jgi:outer membrane receptor protein involved in Fe transport
MKPRFTLPRWSYLVSLLLLAITAGSVTAQGLGRAGVRGVVKDDAGGVIPGVTVTITRAGDSAASPEVQVTEMDGTFHAKELPPGSYTIQTFLDGFQPLSRDVRLVTNQTVDVAFTIVPALSETVEVVASAPQTGEVAILETRRQAAVVSDSISQEEISRTPDANAAAVVERLTGVTLVSDKYVFVRGLGERYSGATINGSTLPTTETEKRVVPLDLFPAKLLASVNVVKTYTPDKPGDFGSGVVEMTTTDFPSDASLKVSIGTGWTSDATGSSFRRYASGLSRLGDGGQGLPSDFPTEILRRSSIVDPAGFTPEELQAFGRQLVGDWTGNETSSAPPGTELSLTYGATFGRLGVVLSGVSRHEYGVFDEEQFYYGVDQGVLVPYNEYDLDTDRETATSGLVGNFSLRLTDSNRLFLNMVRTTDASAESRTQAGLQSATGGNIRDYRVRYQDEAVLSTRLRGEHNLGGPGLGSLIEWSGSQSRASNDADLRENVYREADPGVYRLETGYADTGKIEIHELDDEISQAGAAYSVFFTEPSGRWSGSVKGGFDWLDRARDFGARRFRFVPGSGVDADLELLPNDIFLAENITPAEFEIREFTGVNDAYAAAHTVGAGYLMADATFGKWRFIGGARYESSEQSVTTFDPFNVDDAVQSVNDSNDLLPSLNVVYEIAPRTNIRLAYGRSLNRPEFRELSPFVFTEVAGGRSISGNPNLVQATLDSYDLRWELFPGSGDVIAVSAFYKHIDQPIERIIQPTTDLRMSFINAESAKLAGIELEFRRSLGPIFSALRNWAVNLNYAYIDSGVEVGQQNYSVVTSTERPLEGQSDQTANLALQYYQPDWGTMFRIMAGYSGPRLTEVGAFGLPDIYEDSYTSLDAVVTQRLGFAQGLKLKLAASNLLDQPREYVQGGEIQRTIDPGRRIGLLLSYTPF